MTKQYYLTKIGYDTFLVLEKKRQKFILIKKVMKS